MRSRRCPAHSGLAPRLPGLVAPALDPVPDPSLVALVGPAPSVPALAVPALAVPALADPVPAVPDLADPDLADLARADSAVRVGPRVRCPAVVRRAPRSDPSRIADDRLPPDPA